MDCEHLSRREIHEGVLHIQQCHQCGMIREYNPNQKKVRLATDPDLWSEWVEGHHGISW